MSVTVITDDQGTIEATKRKFAQLKRDGPPEFDRIMDRFMIDVYNQTITEMNNMGIRDTGALIASTRKERIGSPAKYDMVTREARSNWQVISGGGGVINRKNRREVDYAKAVHDGHATRGGGWVVGRPYLDVAWAKMETKWKPTLDKYLKWIEKEWSKDQPITTGTNSIFKLPQT